MTKTLYILLSLASYGNGDVAYGVWPFGDPVSCNRALIQRNEALKQDVEKNKTILVENKTSCVQVTLQFKETINH